jgi:8-oxo-dGTP diphosphatase
MSKIEVRVEAVIFNSEGDILMALHKKKGDSYWVLPGGHVEYGQKMKDDLEREMMEELNIKNAYVYDLLFLDEYIDAEEPRHVIKAGFRADIPEDEKKDIQVVADHESIKDASFLSAYDINSSMDVFYPSKEFFLRILEDNNG